jgi:hypothetical protein
MTVIDSTSEGARGFHGRDGFEDDQQRSDQYQKKS